MGWSEVGGEGDEDLWSNGESTDEVGEGLKNCERARDGEADGEGGGEEDD